MASIKQIRRLHSQLLNSSGNAGKNMEQYSTEFRISKDLRTRLLHYLAKEILILTLKDLNPGEYND